MNAISHIRIGTRGSKLALAQAYLVRDLLCQHHSSLTAEIVIIKTTGDTILDRNLNEIGGKGLFVKEIEEALLQGSIDIAVHSMKDVPAFLPDGLEIPCMLEREDPRDALVSYKTHTITDLPQGAVVGTSSPRRAAQALSLRPDLKIVPFRGNIHTRLQKLQNNEVDATFLAVAGLKRAEISGEMITPISLEQMLPAVAQGALGIEIRKNQPQLHALLTPLHHGETYTRVLCERAFLEAFEGSCRTPLGALAEIHGDTISAQFLIASMDGANVLRTTRQGLVSEAEALGHSAAEELKNQIDDDFF